MNKYCIRFGKSILLIELALGEREIQYYMHKKGNLFHVSVVCNFLEDNRK